MPIQKRTDGVAEIVMRRYAAGKCFAFAEGDAGYATIAEAALRRAITLRPTFSAARFLAEMQVRGVPDEVAAAYCQSARTTDETFFRDVDQ